MNVFGLLVDTTSILLIVLIALVVLTILWSRKRLTRLLAIIGQKVDEAMGFIDSPKNKIDRVYNQKVNNLHRLNEGLVQLTTAKVKLEELNIGYASKIKTQDAKLKKNVEENDREHAETNLKIKKMYSNIIKQTEERIESIKKRIETSIEIRDKAKLDVELFSAQRGILKSRLSAGESMKAIHRDLLGVGSGGEDSRDLMNEVEDQLRGLESENAALDELQNRGVLEQPQNGVMDWVDVSKELDELFGVK